MEMGFGILALQMHRLVAREISGNLPGFLQVGIQLRFAKFFAVHKTREEREHILREADS